MAKALRNRGNVVYSYQGTGMKKLKLRLDDLRVEGFQMMAALPEEGTVIANEASAQACSMAAPSQCVTCDYSCTPSCLDSCSPLRSCLC